MSLLEKNIERLCSFYVSDWHLVTMLLPYVNKKINEKANIITLLENNIEENIKILIKKLNLKNKEKILNLNWNKSNGIKYSEIREKINKNDAVNIIFINGSKDYIDIANKNIERLINEDNKKINIKIINCYEVGEFNFNIKEILDKHDKIINTSGEKEINEVFDGYAQNLQMVKLNYRF